jgi:hypothetical protein
MAKKDRFLRWRQLKELISQLTEEELDREVFAYNTELGIWCYPVGILIQRLDEEGLQVVLDDELIEEFWGKIVRE